MLLPLLLMSTALTVSTVNASSEEMTLFTDNASSEDNLSCHDKGVMGGNGATFLLDTYAKCGDDYMNGFTEGCLEVRDPQVCNKITNSAVSS